MLKRRRLPHVHVPGQPLFLTFRLHGSLPPHRPFPTASLTSGQAFVAMDRLLDQARCGAFFLRQREVAEVVHTSLHHGAALGHYSLHAWAIMPNHVHVLLTPRVRVARFVDSLKSASARRANLLLRRTGQPFWQDESYDHLVRSDEEFGRIRRYIENNPVTAGLAATAEEYEWSSARQAAFEADPGGTPAHGAAPPGCGCGAAPCAAAASHAASTDSLKKPRT